MKKNPDIQNTAEFIIVPGFHPVHGVIQILREDLKHPLTQEWLKYLIKDAPPVMAGFLETLLKRDQVTSLIKLKTK